MKKILFFVIFFYSGLNEVFAHVQHYNNIKNLEYDIFFNKKLVGKHFFEFKKEGKIVHVKSYGGFEVNKLGLLLMDYQTGTEEIYNKGILMKFSSDTRQNDKIKYVRLKNDEKNGTFSIDGSSFKGKIPIKDIVVGTWWNHEIINKNNQISPISGRVIKQKVKFLGKKKIIINDKKYNALSFNFLSDDNKPLNKKKLNINVFYDEKTLLWIKMSYEKLGFWEYRLKKVEYF